MRALTLLLGLMWLLVAAIGSATAREETVPSWESANPLVPLPPIPLGLDRTWESLPNRPTPEQVRLGRWLFFDKRLSADGTVSCATCHRPGNAFSEPVAVSIGIGGQYLTFAQPDGRQVTRRTPPLINQTWPLAPNFFWDGRGQSLDEIDILPVSNPQAMGSSHEVMVETLSKSGYGPYFERAFGASQIKKADVGRAIAAFHRTLLSGNSPWDRWRRNKDESAISAQVKEGHALFVGRAQCVRCHFGENFSDYSFHNLGVGWDRASSSFLDVGRFNVTQNEADRGAFRTPTLRDLPARAPYMHDGSLRTLTAVVQFYNRGGIPNPGLDRRMRALGLTAGEVAALVAFMEALAGAGYDDALPTVFPEGE